MRNELVVSFFFYIGLSSGNTVPSSVTKFTTEQMGQKYSTTINVVTDTPTTSTDDTKFKATLRFDLKDHRNTIKDSEILSQGVESPNNINGRSFIFIRQKFKSPMLNLFHSQMLNPNDVINGTPKSALSNIDNDKFEELSRRFATLNIANQPKDKAAMDRMSKTLDKTQGTLLSQLCYSRLKLENDGMINKIKDKLKIQDVEKAANDHREYLELLKPPLLRKNLNEDVTKLAIQEKDRQLIEASKVPPYVRNQDTFAKISSNIRDSLIKKYNKDNRSYKPKGSYTKNKVTNHHHNQQQHDLRDGTFNKVEESLVRKVYEESTDDYKGMGKFVKNNIDIKLKDKMKPAHINRIHYCHDCGKNVNNDPYHRKRIEADCKCGRHVYLKGRSEWEDQEQPGALSISPTDKHQITVRYSPTDNKEEKSMIDVAIAQNPHLY